jgi:membrane fusion protein, multidrug efflux system
MPSPPTTAMLRAAGATALLSLAVAAGTLGCSAEDRSAPAASVRRPVGVTVETVRRSEVDEAVEAVGTIRSRAQTALSSKIVATVRAVTVREGEHVRAGQSVVVLDDRDVQAQYRRADAALAEARSARDETERAIAAADRAVEAATAQQDLARATWTRYKRLVDDGIVSVQDYEEAAARAKVAAADVARSHEVHASLLARRQQGDAAIARAVAERDAATLTVGYATIAAPADAVVVARTVEAGNLAAPGTVLLTLEEEDYRLEATVQESDVSRLHVGDHASVTLDAVGQTVTGRIVEIVPAADPVSRTFVAKIQLPRLAGIRSGVYGRARFGAGRRPALTVPRNAVTERGQLEAVFVVDGGQAAVLRLVKSGKRFGERVEVLSGLVEGDRVVVQSAEWLADGQPIAIRP